VSAGDQLMASLGTWKYGLIPGIVTTDHLADDIHNSHLRFILDHEEVGTTGMDAVLMNAKGFGGNNATGAILSPQVTEGLLEKKYGRRRMSEYRNCNQAVAEAADQYDRETIAGRTTPIYRFDHNVVAGEDLVITQDELKIPGYSRAIDLRVKNPYTDMT
jgi:acetoacetyl-[acyl-carrier protein] synthase